MKTEIINLMIIVTSDSLNHYFTVISPNNYNTILKHSSSYCWDNEEEETQISIVMNQIFASLEFNSYAIDWHIIHI